MTTIAIAATDPELSNPNPMVLSRILVTVDTSPAAARAVEAAAIIARAAGAELIVFSAAEHDRNPGNILTGEVVRAFVGGLADADINVRGEAATDPSVRVDIAVTSAVRRLHPDLVVLGAPTRGRSWPGIAGRVATALLASGQCPILIVPQDRPRS